MVIHLVLLQLGSWLDIVAVVLKNFRMRVHNLVVQVEKLLHTIERVLWRQQQNQWQGWVLSMNNKTVISRKR